MATPKIIKIKETLIELKLLLKKSSPLIAPRIRMLIEVKKNEDTGISKRDTAKIIGVNPNSVQKWRTLYISGGIELLKKHNKKGFKPSIYKKEEHKKIEEKLKDPGNGLRGYIELLDWVETEFKKQIKYNTLLKYSIKHFGSKIKTARKSHIKKNKEAVVAFKKTSVKSVKKRQRQNEKNLKK